MSIHFNCHSSSGVTRSYSAQDPELATQKSSNNNSSTISSLDNSTKRNCLNIVFAPFIYLWNLIFNRSSLPQINQETIILDICSLYHVKKAIQSKDLQYFNKAYGTLSNDGENFLQNIYCKWVVEQRNAPYIKDAPYANLKKYIKDNPFQYALESSCNKAIENLVKLSKFKSFVEVLRITDENKTIVDQFGLLPYDIQQGIKYTIWKVLNPQNNSDSDFGGTILKKYATDPFIKDVVIAAVKGLKKTDDHKQWYLEMPSGWASRKKFSV